MALIAPAASLAAEAATALEEVVVTAQRRNQSVQQVGVAITAISGEDVQTLRLQQPLSLAAVSPSLSTMNATTDSTPLFLIRGIGLDDFNMNNSSGVGTYLDEVFASFPGFLTAAMYDVDRIEILEGPQGSKKSTALRALAGPYFTDELADLGVKTRRCKRAACGSSSFRN